MRTLVRTTVVAAALVLGLGACSKVQEVADDVLSAALRTAASQAVKEAAAQAGFPLREDPKCEGGVTSGTDSAAISCTAVTEAGQPVTASVKVTNAGDAQNCSGELVINVPNQAPITQKFTACGG